MGFSHDPLYVMTALLFASIGSVITVMLFGRAQAVQHDAKPLWSVMAGIIGGSTIWTTHFILLLGMDRDIERLYFLFMTLGSLVLSSALGIVGFYLASTPGRNARVELGGVFLGLGIVGGHVLSVFALNVIGTRSFDWPRLWAGVAVGVLFSVVSVNRKARRLTKYCKAASVVALVIGIFAVHYVGVTGIRISQGDYSWLSDIGITDRYAFVLVIFFGSMTLIMGGVVFALDHRTNLARVKELEHREVHDRLTGLPNRAMLERQLDQLPGSVASTALVTFDLNRFKDINDVHGHRAGDFVLTAVADRLRAVLRDDERLFRTGGDEFVAVKLGVATRTQAAYMAARLRDAVIGEIAWERDDGRTLALSVGSSVGIAMFPCDASGGNDLMVKADLAMYRAKRTASAEPLFYEASVDDRNREKSILSIDLRTAMERDEFELFYQQQNSVEKRGVESVVTGFEVLLRWNHHNRGYVSPDVFIPIAERDGFINEIGEWVMKKACREAAAWPTPTKIAVNVAARQLAGDELPGIVRQALAESGLHHSRLEIEITESGIIADIPHALKIVGELKEIGVSIAMDDFGKGFSSLSTLQALPFDKIKIDQSFVKLTGTNGDPQSNEIVKATVMLGRRLNIDVLAEGVETEEHLDFLERVGCTQAQGFLFGKPIASRDMPPHARGRSTREKVAARR